MELSVGELACTYAALILHDDSIPVTAEKISILLKSANLNVESYWPNLFAKLCAKKNVDELILNTGSGGGAPVDAVVAAAPQAAAASKVEEEPSKAKLDKDESSDDEDLGDLFSMFD